MLASLGFFFSYHYKVIIGFALWIKQDVFEGVFYMELYKWVLPIFTCDNFITFGPSLETLLPKVFS